MANRKGRTASAARMKELRALGLPEACWGYKCEGPRNEVILVKLGVMGYYEVPEHTGGRSKAIELNRHNGVSIQ